MRRAVTGFFAAVALLSACGSEATAGSEADVFTDAAEVFQLAAPAATEICCTDTLTLTIISESSAALQVQFVESLTRDGLGSGDQAQATENLMRDLGGLTDSQIEQVQAGEEFEGRDIPAEFRAFDRLMVDLGFSQGDIDRISSTRAVDGMLTAESETATASWTFHPDDGLHVILERQF